MLSPIDQSPLDTELTIAAIGDPELAERLGRLGVRLGDKVVRLGEEASQGPVRVLGPKGEVILAEGMASKVIAHHDDGHKTPVLEMEPGEEGHVEGLICGSALEQGLAVLGIRENDRLKMLRRVPPMQYQALVDGKRVLLSEGQAAKVWVRQGERRMQLATSPTGEPLVVEALLGGRRARAMLESQGLLPEASVVLEEVRPAQFMGKARDRGQVVLAARSGLRLYLRQDQAGLILVKL